VKPVLHHLNLFIESRRREEFFEWGLMTNRPHRVSMYRHILIFVSNRWPGLSQEDCRSWALPCHLQSLLSHKIREHAGQKRKLWHRKFDDAYEYLLSTVLPAAWAFNAAAAEENARYADLLCEDCESMAARIHISLPTSLEASLLPCPGIEYGRVAERFIRGLAHQRCPCCCKSRGRDYDGVGAVLINSRQWSIVLSAQSVKIRLGTGCPRRGYGLRGQRLKYAATVNAVRGGAFLISYYIGLWPAFSNASSLSLQESDLPQASWRPCSRPWQG